MTFDPATATATILAVAAIGALWATQPDNDPEPANPTATALGAITGITITALTGAITAGPVLAIAAPIAVIDAKHQRLPWWGTNIMLAALAAGIVAEAFTGAPLALPAITAATITVVYAALAATGFGGQGDIYYVPGLAWVATAATNQPLTGPVFVMAATGGTLAALIVTNRVTGRKTQHAAGPGMFAAAIITPAITPAITTAAGL